MLKALLILLTLLAGCSSPRQPVEEECRPICMYGPQEPFYIYTCPGTGCDFLSGNEDEADQHVEKCKLIKDE